ncbi:hypothetical protein [Pyrodictium abyssi]|uniref:Uncharacterized protein n=1 Tax=Pyrodictium abyssi TaxID=54256 RepID=A0ABN6ZLN7_9CREN|nr:hypothetical protein PABY_07140 [Pyrodictium abyssi]
MAKNHIWPVEGGEEGPRWVTAALALVVLVASAAALALAGGSAASGAEIDFVISTTVYNNKYSGSGLVIAAKPGIHVPTRGPEGAGSIREWLTVACTRGNKSRLVIDVWLVNAERLRQQVDSLKLVLRDAGGEQLGLLDLLHPRVRIDISCEPGSLSHIDIEVEYRLGKIHMRPPDGMIPIVVAVNASSLFESSVEQQEAMRAP